MLNGVYIILLLLIVSDHDPVDEMLNGYKINYTVKARSHIKDIQQRINAGRYGDEMDLLLANGYYKQSFSSGAHADETIYNYLSNHQYQLYSGEDTLYYIDCGEENRIFQSLEIDSNMITLAGHLCTCHTLKTNEITYRYCFSNDVKMDVGYFSHHRFGFFNSIMDACQGPYLYLELAYPTYTIAFIANTIEEVRFDDSIFYPDTTLLKKIELF